MTQPTFDDIPIAHVRLSQPTETLAHVTGGSFRHQSKINGNSQMILTLAIGDIAIQCADPNWFRHLIDQANTALTSAGHPPHHTASNDDAPERGKGAA